MASTSGTAEYMCTSSASNGQPPHIAASIADAVAGPTPFKSDVRVATAFFNFPEDTFLGVTISSLADEVEATKGEGRCRNASRLLALTFVPVQTDAKIVTISGSTIFNTLNNYEYEYATQGLFFGAFSSRIMSELSGMIPYS